MSEGVQRDLGRLEAHIANLTKQLDELDKDVKAIGVTLSEARGGWRTLMYVSGASAAIGGLVAKLASYWMTIPLPR